MVGNANEVLTVALPSDGVRDGSYEGAYSVFVCLFVCTSVSGPSKTGLQEPPGIPCPPRAGLQPGVYQGPEEGCSALPLGIGLTPV